MSTIAAFVERTVDRLKTRPDLVITTLFCAHVVLKVAVYPLVLASPAYNDEQQYYDGARALSNLVRDVFGFSAPDGEELQANVVASGWFMPGMSILMAPLFVVFPDAPEWLCRLYLGSANLLVLFWAVRSLRRHLGPWWAALVLVFPAMLPAWALLTFTAYGDPVSGLVLVVLVAHVIDMLRTLRAGDAPGWKESVRLGLLAIAVLYLRSSTMIVLAALGLVTLLAAVVLLKGVARLQALLQAGLAAAVFLVLLAPWSVAASYTLGTPVLTTTTVPISLANTFGDREQVCFGKCDPDSFDWFRPLRYAREVGRATGESEVEVSAQMSGYALRDLDRTDYARHVWWNTGAYFVIPGNYVRKIVPEGGRGLVGLVYEWIIHVSTYLLYLPVLVLVLASLFRVQLRSLEAQLLDAITKLCLAALLVQPFVHIAGSRYWTTAGPLFALAAAGLVREQQVRRRGAPRARAPLSGADARLSAMLQPLQYALVAAFALVVLVMAVLAI